MPVTVTSVFGALRGFVVSRFWELLRFGSVGGVAFLVDMGVFNLLVHGPGEILGHKPLISRGIAVGVATVVAWIGNRYWTFTARKTSNRVREFAGFAVVNVGGLLISVGCLGFSRYVLGLSTVVADNAANLVGLVLGMIFRYFAYRTFVFTEVGGAGGDARPDADAAPERPADAVGARVTAAPVGAEALPSRESVNPGTSS